jgi:serine/threonine protein kinase
MPYVGRVNGITLQTALKTEDPGFSDFMERLLRLDPHQRATAEVASHHDWMQSYPQRPPVSQ